MPGIRFHLVSIGPERYNQLYPAFGNLNRFLAWGHATVIEGLAAKVPDCPMALSDQFANPFVLKRALAAKRCVSGWNSVSGRRAMLLWLRHLFWRANVL